MFWARRADNSKSAGENATMAFRRDDISPKEWFRRAQNQDCLATGSNDTFEQTGPPSGREEASLAGLPKAGCRAILIRVGNRHSSAESTPHSVDTASCTAGVEIPQSPPATYLS